MSTAPVPQRFGFLTLLSVGGIGAGIALLVQFWLSSQRRASLVPPYSMSVTLAGLAVLLVVLALRLRRQLAKGTGAVNPFQAVRLLATARAGQLVGALFAGFGGGLLLSLFGRTVPAPVPTWLPMLVTAVAGAALLAAALVAEHVCRVPPNDDDPEADAAGVARLES